MNFSFFDFWVSNTKCNFIFRLVVSNLMYNFSTSSFFNCYLPAPRPTLAHSQGNSLTTSMLITAFLLSILTQGHQEPLNEIGFLNLVDCLVGFEPGTFWFSSQRLNPWGLSPQTGKWKNKSLIFELVTRNETFYFSILS